MAALFRWGSLKSAMSVFDWPPSAGHASDRAIKEASGHADE
jgi:hypothetical protein